MSKGSSSTHAAASCSKAEVCRQTSGAFDRLGCCVCLLHPVPQYLGELGAEFVVFKNDEKTVDEIRAMNPAGILVSPGPGKGGP